MRELLPDDELQPTYTPLGVDKDRQAVTLRRLRDLENEARGAEWLRNDLICTQALSHSVSRPDMGRAIGVSRSRIDQIIAEHIRLRDEQRYAQLRERAERHASTPGD